MANLGYFFLSVTGPEKTVQDMKARVNAHLRKQTDTDLWDFDLPKMFPGCTHDWAWVDAPWGEGEFTGHQRHGVRRELVQALSAEWPTLMFRLSYNVENEEILRVFECQAGDLTLIEWRSTFFYTARPDEPIHHYCICIEFDKPDAPDVQQALKDAGVLIEPIDDPNHEYQCDLPTRHQPDQVAAILGKVNVRWRMMPMTLNELEYLHFQQYHDGTLYGDPTWQTVGRVCERDIKLTESEQQYLIDHLTPYLANDWPRASYDVRRLQDLSGNGAVGPIGVELRCLMTMPDLSPARRREIEHAYLNPPWSTAWKWEHKATSSV